MEENKENKNWYDKSHKIILGVSLFIFVLSLIYLSIFLKNNGDIINKDVSLTGGTTITVFDEEASTLEIKEFLSSKFGEVNVRKLSDFLTGSQKGFYVESQTEPEELKKAMEEFLGYELNENNSSIEFSGSALSQGFYNQLRTAIIIAFIFMAIVIFLIFRTFVPSMAVILSAFADIVMTLSVVNLLGMQLSLAGVIAFLMLIGYSVDTDILLTSRVIRDKKGTVNSRIYDSMKTGLTMTITSMAAIAVSLIIISGVSDVLRQIFTILLIGLCFDIFNTWFTNAAIIKIYAERREKR